MEKLKEENMVKEMQVFSTKDYSIFSFVEGNRNINDLHVERLKQSMKEEYLMSPIIVNEKFQIIDGQHRFKAIEDLGKTVYFVICQGYSLEEVHRLNQLNQTWDKKDFLHGYIDKGVEAYKECKKFMDKYKLTSVNIAIELLDIDRSHRIREKQFKNGEWEITSQEWAEELMEKVIDFEEYFKSWNSVLFIKAFKRLYSVDNYEHENMKKKLKYSGGDLSSRATISQYLSMLTEIYNFKTHGKKRKIFYDEKEDKLFTV